MRQILTILFFFTSCLFGSGLQGQLPSGRFSFEFYGDPIEINADPTVAVPFNDSLSEWAIEDWHRQINLSHYQPLVDALLNYRQQNQLNDWLYYQLIRQTAQQLAPKADNYYRYTLYKWFLMVKSGYDATLNMLHDELLFYVYSADEIFDIPYYIRNDNQYVCLNIHDYAKAKEQAKSVLAIDLDEPEATKSFSYKITRLPDFKASTYTQKELEFPYQDSTFRFVIQLNPAVKKIFANYPVVDFASYFNIPLSQQTYKSLIPLLKENVKGMKMKNGVDYLMNFTRYAFVYENDQQNFGKEKRMAPEETLLNRASDCDDRVALFFYLVKEIYNLPMLALMYSTHITIAVQFDKPFGNTVLYSGKKYSICEPTPQQKKLAVGKIAPQLRNQPFQVVYAYAPQ